jgi:hypothetical protein
VGGVLTVVVQVRGEKVLALDGMPEPFSRAVTPGSSNGLSTPFLVDADVAFLLNTMEDFPILQEFNKPALVWWLARVFLHVVIGWPR